MVIPAQIWLKNAFQCAYCGLVIHIKCYDKTIEKSICSRFDMHSSSSAAAQRRAIPDQARPVSSHNPVDDSFQEIHSSELEPTQQQQLSGPIQPSRTGALVSSLFNTIRQRKGPAVSNTNTEKDNVSLASSNGSIGAQSTASYLKAKYLGDSFNAISFGKSVSAAGKSVVLALFNFVGKHVLFNSLVRF